MMNPWAEFEYILISQSQFIQLNVMVKLQNFYSSGITANTSKYNFIDKTNSVSVNISLKLKYLIKEFLRG